MKASLKLFFAAGMFLLAGNAFAQETDGPPEKEKNYDGSYEPKTGEPIVYGKKYYPTEVKSDLFLEVNPVLLINRGLGFEFEMRGGEHTSFGADIQYRNAELYDSAGYRGRSQYFAFAPKMRIYPIETMSGVFFGFKLLIGQVSSEIETPQRPYSFATFQVAPAVHAGYRITSFGGFSLALYVGGGINLPKSEIKQDDVPSDGGAQEARKKVNAEQGTFRPDFGFTIGIAL